MPEIKTLNILKKNHACKTSRKNINSDIFYRLLLSSDLLISSVREIKKK